MSFTNKNKQLYIWELAALVALCATLLSGVWAEGRLYFHSALSGHKVDAARACDKASFCVIQQDRVQPKDYTTHYRSVIAFGRIRIVEDEAERLAAARLLGNRYNPGDEEGLQRELEKGLARMLVLRFDIEHLTGKEAIELVAQAGGKDSLAQAYIRF